MKAKWMLRVGVSEFGLWSESIRAMTYAFRYSILSTALHAIVWLALILGIIATPAEATPPSIVVNSTADTIADDGTCTLREAIISANTNVASGASEGECAAGSAAPAVDTIAFDIPNADPNCTGAPKVCTIKTTYLPWITDPVFIDGYTQPGSSTNTLVVGDDAVLLVEIDSSEPGWTLGLGGLSEAEHDGSGSTIRGLIINHGICISCGTIHGSNNITIIGNFIGTDGTSALSGAFGIEMMGSTGSVIGGTAPADRNVIAGSPNWGISLGYSDSTIVQGNYVGIDRTGTTALPNDGGIEVFEGSNNLIGGSIPGAGNVVGGWGAYAIRLYGNPGSGIATDNNIVQGNLVGTDATGTVRLDAGGVYGVDYTLTGAGNKIGGEAPGEGNVITGARNTGIKVWSGSVAVLGNAIYANGNTGISLSGLDAIVPTQNDDGDPDTGPNNKQNYPLVSDVTFGPEAGVHFSGSLDSIANTTFRLEFFASIKCGEGKVFLGSTQVTTNLNDVAFGPLDFTVPIGLRAITATATDPAGNTSEFSDCAAQDYVFAYGWESSY